MAGGSTGTTPRKLPSRAEASSHEDTALELSVAQVIVEAKLYAAAFIREQTDLPPLVRSFLAGL